MSNNRPKLNRNARQTILVRASLDIQNNDQVWHIVKQPDLTAQEIEAVANFYMLNTGMRNALPPADQEKNSIFHYIAANTTIKDDEKIRFAVTQLVDTAFHFDPLTIKNATNQTMEDVAWDKLNTEIVLGIQASNRYEKSHNQTSTPNASSSSKASTSASSSSSSSTTSSEPKPMLGKVPEEIWQIFKGGEGDLKKDLDKIQDYFSDNKHMINAQDPETGNTIMHYLAKNSQLDVLCKMMGETRAEKYIGLSASFYSKYHPDASISNNLGMTYTEIDANNKKIFHESVVQNFPLLLAQDDLSAYQVNLLKQAVSLQPDVPNRKDRYGSTPLHVLVTNKKMDDLVISDIAREITLQSFKHKDAKVSNVINPSILNNDNQSALTLALANGKESFLSGIQDATQELLKKPGSLSKEILSEVKKLDEKVQYALTIHQIEKTQPQVINQLKAIIEQIKNGNDIGRGSFEKDSMNFFVAYPALINYPVGKQGNIMHYLAHFSASDSNPAKVCNQFESLMYKLMAVSNDPEEVNKFGRKPSEVTNAQAEVATKLLETAKDNMSTPDEAVKKVAHYDFKKLFEMSHENNERVREIKKHGCEFLMQHKEMGSNKLYAAVARELNVIQASPGLFGGRPRSTILPPAPAASSSKEVQSDRGPAPPGGKKRDG